jgi:LPS sulfotransferase NodH
VDGADVGRFQIDQTELWLGRALAFRATPAAQSVRILDIGYTDLVADPVATLGRVYAAADLDPPDTTALIRRHHSSQPRNAKGTHRYRPQDFGINPDELRERMAFYTQQFTATNTS